MLIGPFPGNTPCPWCEGTGIDHEKDIVQWIGTVSQGRSTTFIRVIACDGCAGIGKVTRKNAKQMEESPDIR